VFDIQTNTNKSNYIIRLFDETYHNLPHSKFSGQCYKFIRCNTSKNFVLLAKRSFCEKIDGTVVAFNLCVTQCSSIFTFFYRMRGMVKGLDEPVYGKKLVGQFVFYAFAVMHLSLSYMSCSNDMTK